MTDLERAEYFGEEARHYMLAQCPDRLQKYMAGKAALMAREAFRNAQYVLDRRPPERPHGTIRLTDLGDYNLKSEQRGTDDETPA